MKRVLITGGFGFIGAALSLKLVEKGYAVTILDNLSKQIHGENAIQNSTFFQQINEKVTFVFGSITSVPDLKKAMLGQHIIVHLASETGTGQSMYEIHKYVAVNSDGTALLLEQLSKGNHDVKKVILASSRAIYGEGKYESPSEGIVYPKHRKSDDLARGDFDVKYKESNEPLRVLATDEESKAHPSSVYGITKQNQEQLVMTVCPTLGIDPVALRFQNVYGPGQSLKNPYTGILSIFSTQIKNHNGISVYEDGKESRDFVYIDDAVDAIVLSIERKEADGEIFNVGSGVATDVLTVVETLLKYYKIEVPVRITGQYRIGDIRHNYADIQKINALLDFSPRYSFDEGMKQFTDWVNAQKIEADGYAKSEQEMKLKGIFK